MILMKPQHWQQWKGERLCTWNKSNCGIYLILCPGFKHTDTWPQCTYPCHCMGLQDHCEHRPRRKSYLHIWKMTRIRRWYELKNNYRDHNWSTLPICAFMALNTFIKYTYLKCTRKASLINWRRPYCSLSFKLKVFIFWISIKEVIFF